MAKVTLTTLEAIEKIHGIEGMNITRGFYKSIFDFVLKQNELKNGDDWKGAIRSIIHCDALDADADAICHAVIYFTGNPDCKVEVFQIYYIRITTAGYRAGPAGDH